ncbi:MAG: hypothetical protein H6Q73_939 [Firmicutes bacterium]|nr:hypothetical protein [Bacillota bacterium]
MLKNKLKQIRLKYAVKQGHDVPQTEFAEFLGVKLSQYNRYEMQKQQPEIETAFRISRKLGCKVDDLFDYE